MTSPVTEETTLGELAEMMLARAISSAELRTYAVFAVSPGSSKMALHATGRMRSSRLRSEHSSTCEPRDNGDVEATTAHLSLAEAISALLAEIPTVEVDHG